MVYVYIDLFYFLLRFDLLSTLTYFQEAVFISCHQIWKIFQFLNLDVIDYAVIYRYSVIWKLYKNIIEQLIVNLIFRYLLQKQFFIVIGQPYIFVEFRCLRVNSGSWICIFIHCHKAIVKNVNILENEFFLVRLWSVEVHVQVSPSQ